MSAVERLLEDLAAIPSVSGQEERACRYLRDALPSLGWEESFLDEVGNVVATRGRGERELLLVGHVDTVPGGPPLRRADRFLWGRGTVDAKGPLCALAVGGGRARLPEGWRLTFVGAVGEERDSRGMRHRLSRHTPWGCVIGEPSGTDGVTLAYRGRLLLRLSARDGGAHRSGSSGPLTACLRAAAAVLDEVELRDDKTAPLAARTSGAVAFMEGREEGARHALVELDLRLPLGADPEEWTRNLEILATLQQVELEVLDSVAAAERPKNDPAVLAFRTAVRSVLGTAPRLLAKGGTADFNLAALWGCPLVAYGPGDSKLDHTDQERLNLDDLETATTVVERALSAFAAAERA